jgi:hypothetical protein
MHYGPDETLRRNRPFELPKKVWTRYAVRQPWDIWTVWVIFKDVCEQNHARMLAVLRATQLACFQALLEVKQAVQK